MTPAERFKREFGHATAQSGSSPAIVVFEDAVSAAENEAAAAVAEPSESAAAVLDPASMRAAGGAGGAFAPPPGPLFMYGTLREPALFAAITGVDPERAPIRLRAARAPGFRIAALRDPGHCARYPVLASAAGAAEGLLVEGLGPEAMARLYAYEGADYRLAPLQVECEGAAVAAFTFTPAELNAARAVGAPEWSFETWRAAEGPLTLAVGRRLGALFDGARPGDFDHLYALADTWPELIGGATAALKRDGPVASLLGPSPGRAAAREVERTRDYDAFFKVDRIQLRRRRLDDSGQSDAIERACFRSGAAVCVLPYDPVSDRVLLIEQFRIGPWAEHDAQPWLIEAIAGRIDKVEGDGADPAVETARRESVEEAGVTLGRIERVYEGYSTPGVGDELLIHFVAEAELPAPPEGAPERVTHHGLAGEGEDIRAFTMPIDDALAALAAGEIRNGPTALLLLLAHRRRPQLQALWRR